MKPRSSYQSLRFKITAGVLVPVLLILGMSSYLQYTRHRDLLVERMAATTDATSELIEGGLQHAMLTQDPTEIQQIVDEIAKQKGIKNLFLLNKRGEVRISPGKKMVGVKLDQSDPTCQICHQYSPLNRSRSVVFATASGERVFRSLNPIDNRQECHTCHNPWDRINGILITDFSMAEIDSQLAADLRNNLLWSAVAIVATILTTNLMLSQLVVVRLERFVETIKRFGQGDTDQRVAIKGQDEIGDLARAFNRMADGLRDKERLEHKVRERTAELQAQTERLSVLNTIAATVSQSLNLDEILNSALGKVLDLMKLRAGWVFLENGEGQPLQLVTHRGLSPEFAREESGRAPGDCVCRQVLASGQAMVMADVRQCPCLSQAVIEREGLVCHASVPLQARDRVLGIMNLASHEADGARCFTDDELRLLTAIGHQIGIAIENARLYEELQRKEELRGQLLEKAITAQEEERKRVARELHDGFAQTLTALLMSVEASETVIPEELTSVRERLARTKALTSETLAQTRKLILDLRPSVLDDLGLVPAIRWYAEGHLEEQGIKVELKVSGAKRRLPAEIETTLFRIVQEAINNIAKHAGASEVHIGLDFCDGLVTSVIEDNGCGFDVEATAARRDGSGGLGLLGMKERAVLVGGSLTVTSQPGRGTRLCVEVPVDREQGER